MINKNNERFSALMDGELENFDQDLEQLSNNEELRQRWLRYHLIRDAVSGHFTEAYMPDLTSKISQALENEPTILAPRRFKSHHILKQVAGLAIAATVSTVAIISIQQTPEHLTQPQSYPTVASIPASNFNNSNSNNYSPVQSLSNKAEVRFLESKQALLSLVGSHSVSSSSSISSNVSLQNLMANQATSAKLNSYLVNHNEYAVSTKMQGMLPYMRIVGVTPNERIVEPPIETIVESAETRAANAK
ncbi:MAG: sigma-E factor negative regulatory protein [Gammaproteobacteria bacterium]|nr:sigma-E factor negative regulatory protein [Gammaproteobacteria bacterium]